LLEISPTAAMECLLSQKEYYFLGACCEGEGTFPFKISIISTKFKLFLSVISALYLSVIKEAMAVRGL
jgi:hypothetical protein